ncbi:hypothetical protein [Burkholderia ambifaria]|uniref:hypothetical protein n=1 Tax=Burkholderia ambifaria TaxID=152480 RepID=UPI00159000F8|nr:hypothetical protein [Burkholderia ambifaria]
MTPSTLSSLVFDDQALLIELWTFFTANPHRRAFARILGDAAADSLHGAFALLVVWRTTEEYLTATVLRVEPRHTLVSRSGLTHWLLGNSAADEFLLSLVAGADTTVRDVDEVVARGTLARSPVSGPVQ